MAATAIEKRLAALEKHVEDLRAKIETPKQPEPWWQRIAGTFESDPIYAEAMKLRRKYRRSLASGKSSRKRK